MDLIIYTLKSVAYVMVEPSLIFILILLGVMFFIKNRKLVAMQKMIMGESVNSPLELTLSQIVIGIFAGVLTSLIFSHIGVVFSENSGIEFLFILSLLLMFIKPRFVCFSYSAGILGIISLIFTYFNINTKYGIELFRVDIMCLMTFVAVLHIIEGILIIIDGDRGAIPVFSNKNGKIIGGYALNRYWILPVAIFIAYVSTNVGVVESESILTPDWWPLLKNDTIMDFVKNMILTLVPIYGIIGYSSITFTRTKREKKVSSSLCTIAFGILLFGVAQLSRFGLVGEIVTVVFAPLGHEVMLKIQNIFENNREAMFVSGDDGISILEVVPYSISYDVGLKPGDKIIKLNDNYVESEKDIYAISKEYLNNIILKVQDRRGVIRDVSIKGEKNRKLGVVLVPKSVPIDKAVAFKEKNFSEVLDKMKEKDKDN